MVWRCVIDLRDGGWIELIRDCGHQDDERGAEAETRQGEGGGGRHEEVSPGERGQHCEERGDTQQAEPNDGHQATISGNKEISLLLITIWVYSQMHMTFTKNTDQWSILWLIVNNGIYSYWQLCYRWLLFHEMK